MFTDRDLLKLSDNASLESLHSFMDSYYDGRIKDQLPSFKITVNGIDVKENLLKLGTNVPVSKLFHEFENRNLFSRIRDRWNRVYGPEIVVHTVFDKIQIIDNTIFDGYLEIEELERHDPYKHITISHNRDMGVFLGLKSEIYLLLKLLVLLYPDIRKEDCLFSSIMFMCEDFNKKTGVVEIDLARVLHISRILKNLHPSIVDDKEKYANGPEIDKKWGMSDPNEPTDSRFHYCIKKLCSLDIDELITLEKQSSINAETIMVFSSIRHHKSEALKILSAFNEIREGVKYYGPDNACRIILKFGSARAIHWIPKMEDAGIDKEDLIRIMGRGIDPEMIDSVVNGEMQISWFRSFYYD